MVRREVLNHDEGKTVNRRSPRGRTPSAHRCRRLSRRCRRSGRYSRFATRLSLVIPQSRSPSLGAHDSGSSAILRVRSATVAEEHRSYEFGVFSYSYPARERTKHLLQDTVHLAHLSHDGIPSDPRLGAKSGPSRATLWRAEEAIDRALRSAPGSYLAHYTKD